MEIKVRELNLKGINAFRSFLDDMRNDPLLDIPDDFLNNNVYSKVKNDDVYLNKNEFDNKFDLAKYLYNNIVEDNLIKNIWFNVGLWSWLSILFFDIICPKKDGYRQVLSDYRYILEVSKVGGGWSRFYRHLIASPVRLYAFHFENSRILLSSDFHQSGDMIEQFASKRELAGNKTLIGVLNKLYLNTSTGKMKTGAQTRTKPGTHRRYKSFLNQIGMTYDIQSMKSDELIELLPDEYDPWLS